MFARTHLFKYLLKNPPDSAAARTPQYWQGQQNKMSLTSHNLVNMTLKSLNIIIRYA